MNVFESLAIEHIKKCILSYSDLENQTKSKMSLLHTLKRETISDVRLLCRNEGVSKRTLL